MIDTYKISLRLNSQGKQNFSTLRSRLANNIQHHHQINTCPRGGSCKSRGEERKEAKYISLPAGHQFVPVAVETMGAMGPRTLLFLTAIGKSVTLWDTMICTVSMYNY